MKMKKKLSLLTAAALASSAFAGLAFAETEDDLATISSNATFIAQNETTETFVRDSIHWNNQLLTLNGDNTYNTKKGNSLFNDTEVQNLLQVKQGRNMVLSVGGACTIDVYHDDNSGRIIQAGSTNKGTDYTVVQNVLANGTKNYDVDTITVPTAGLVYIGASGDVFVSVIDVKFDGETPDSTEAPAEPTAAPAEPAELQAVSEATTWTAANFVAGDAETTVISDNGTLALNGTEKAKITVDGTKNRIKMNGKGRVIELLPAAAGTVEVEFTHASSTPSDTRTLTINQNDAVAGSESVDAETTSATASASVTADASVTITSDAALNISSIKFTPGAPVEPPAPVVYTITLVDGDTPTQTEVTSGDTFTFPTPDARVGAEFGGWKLDKVGGDDVIVQGGESITVTGDASYTAVWNPVVAPVTKYTITLDYADGTDPVSTEVENYGGFTFPTPTRDGFTFGGWLVKLGGEDFIVYGGETMTVTDSATYTAVWIVEPTVNVEKIGVFTEDAGNPAAAFKGSVTAGTYAISTLRWVAYTDEKNLTDVDLAVNIASGSTVVTGLVVEAANVDVNAIEAGVGPVDSLDVILDR